MFTVFNFLSPPFSTKHSGIGHAMVNKLHCSVDIILIVSYFGFAVCFLSFFNCRHHYKRGTAVGTLLLTFNSFFSSVVDLLSFTCPYQIYLFFVFLTIFFLFYVYSYIGASLTLLPFASSRN